jgi:hypothetical protein
VGHLFGCISDSHAVGKAIAKSAVDDMLKDGRLRMVPTRIMQTAIAILANERGERAIRRGASDIVYSSGSSSTELRKRRGHPWGFGWRWFRHQYHFVRKADPMRAKPECWRSIHSDSKNRKIGIAIRRGDDNGARGFPVERYGAVLDAVLDGRIDVPKSGAMRTELMIIAETPENDKDIRYFEKYKDKHVSVNYLLGKAILKPRDAVVTRLVRDLDCMTTADGLITSGGTFNSLVRALMNDDGIVIASGWTVDVLAGGEELDTNDIPNMNSSHEMRQQTYNQGDQVDNELGQFKISRSADIPNSFRVIFPGPA